MLLPEVLPEHLQIMDPVMGMTGEYYDHIGIHKASLTKGTIDTPGYSTT
jgi:hypothetical protein